MDLLKRALAPLTDSAWSLVDEVARKTLTSRLVGRKIVDVRGPHGWAHAAVPLGRLGDVGDAGDAGDGVAFGVHRVQPLVEFRVRFDLDVWELDNVERGALDVELGPLVLAAEKAARFEDAAVLRGFAPGGIAGLEQRARHAPHVLPLDPTGLLDGLAGAVLELGRASVGGPYALVLGSRLYRFLSSSVTGYPLSRSAGALVGGPILETDLVEGGLLVSTRGGDFELTLGQDFSIGYEGHDTRQVRLFLAGSFAFRVLDPTAAVPLRLSA